MSTPTIPTPIDPDAIYHDGQVRLLLGLPGATLTRCRRLGTLRHSRQGHSILYRGQWLLDWLEADADGRSSKRETVSHV